MVLTTWQTPSILKASMESMMTTMISTATEVTMISTATEVTTILTRPDKTTSMVRMIPTVSADITIPMAMEANTTCTVKEVTTTCMVTMVNMTLVNIAVKKKIGMKAARMTKANTETMAMNMVTTMGTGTGKKATRSMSERCFTIDF
ncbi:hypothetical protein LTS15_007705 [Exophiala xenobiotica]|nr:hypothetical protein LTS15_007705 [Exophiala xenobiotica]